jgi:hypothetical protein
MQQTEGCVRYRRAIGMRNRPGLATIELLDDFVRKVDGDPG